MHMAMAYDYFETVKLLLDAGADPNLTNNDGHPANKGNYK